MMNNIKSMIQKEEYIALAVNKYIVQNVVIPKKLNSTTNKYELDWDKLLVSEYLGENFNKLNPMLSQIVKTEFDNSNNLFIFGVVTQDSDYNTDNNYLYDFYINKAFRINTIPPKDKTKNDLLIGTQVLYGDTQKNIVNLLNDSKNVILPSMSCTQNQYFYELNDNKLTYKYCKGTYSFDVYQESPIYLENSDDLAYVKAKIGDFAYVKKNGLWYEYYYQGDVTNPWVPSDSGSILTTTDETITLEDRVLSYIPDAKDLVIRGDSGCMLANGDIFCWGNNSYKKSGIENYGQLDTSISPAYINTPVMLKVQINDATRKTKKWYNNPYRIKFDKMTLSSKNVCGISPIYDYLQNGESYKFGGDLYCNGEITAAFYENIESGTTSSILSRNKFFAWGKDDLKDDSPTTRDEIYIKDIAMTDDTIAVLSDEGKIYTLGKNYAGNLGINSSDKFIRAYEPVEVVQDNGIFFEKIYALRDINCFGALDSNKNFWIWGERSNGTAYLKPTRLNDNLRQYNSNYIFVNSTEFILQDVDKNYYRTEGDNITVYVNELPSTAVSVTGINENNNWKYLYVSKDLKLYGDESLITCRTKNDTLCTNTYNKNLFDFALDKLNTDSNFFNVSTYKLDSVIYEVIEDFENGASGWSNNTTTSITDNGDTTQVPATRFLGRFPTNSVCSGNPCSSESPFILTKTYSFPSYANYEVEIEFDFYEIDTWDGERFEFYANNNLIAVDHFVMDGQQYIQDSNISGVDLQDNIRPETGYASDQTYRYKVRTKIDSNGQLVLKFQTSLEFSDPLYANYWSKFDEGVNNESWGIDNINIKIKEKDKHFTCAVTGISNDSQLYCWGVVGRGLPILSTSLYDMDKISNLNKLFVSNESEKKSQMSIDAFYNNGDLYLKYPTYIGGFDYPFYFK